MPNHHNIFSTGANSSTVLCYANSLSALMPTVLCFATQMTYLRYPFASGELLVGIDAVRPLLRELLTDTIRSPMPLCYPMFPYSVQMFFCTISLIPP